jgi:D-aspartate ligase
MGHVLLGEHTPKGLGNHVAIVTEHHPEITEKLCSFLEDIGYRGFANFDILSDKRSGGFTVLELNIRQGRSNYYMTSAGMNVAQLLVKDSKNELPFGRIICRKSVFWHTVPKKIIYNYITESSLLKKARKLAKEGKESTSLFYRKDLFLNPLRAAYVCIHNTRYFGKYKKYR